MRTYLIILLNFVTITLFGQTRNDTVDFNKINHSLINELVFEKGNDERKKVSAVLFKKHEVCFLAAKYQSEYMSSYNILCHTNEYAFQNVKLVKYTDRIEFFSKKLNKEMHSSIEICLMRPFFFNKKITYDDLASQIINQFMKSEPHKLSLLLDTKSESVKYMGFSTSSIKHRGFIRIYVAGVSGFIFPKKNNSIIH
jgi:hypothetical protein